MYFRVSSEAKKELHISQKVTRPLIRFFLLSVKHFFRLSHFFSQTVVLAYAHSDRGRNKVTTSLATKSLVPGASYVWHSYFFSGLSSSLKTRSKRSAAIDGVCMLPLAYQLCGNARCLIRQNGFPAHLPLVCLSCSMNRTARSAAFSS